MPARVRRRFLKPQPNTAMPKESAEIPRAMKTPSPAEQKRQDIIDTATRLFRELLASHHDELVEDAAEAFQNDETAEQPIAKIGFRLSSRPAPSPGRCRQVCLDGEPQGRGVASGRPGAIEAALRFAGRGEPPRSAAAARSSQNSPAARSPGVMSGHIQEPLWLSHWPCWLIFAPCINAPISFSRRRVARSTMWRRA